MNQQRVVVIGGEVFLRVTPTWVHGRRPVTSYTPMPAR